MTNDRQDAKAPSLSQVTMTQLVLPSHTNALGTIFGGTVMSWIDIAAAIAAERHSRSLVVTASIDALHFIKPIKLGYIVTIKASVNFTSRTSMEVGCHVEAENPLTGEVSPAAKAYTTFVALDSNGKPKPVPAVDPQTDEEKRRFGDAKTRRENRIKEAKALKKRLS